MEHDTTTAGAADEHDDEHANEHGPERDAEGTGATTASGPANARVRRLERSTDDKVVAGVCGGLGRYLGVDPVIFRIVAVVLVVAGGSGLLLYGLAWALVPEEGRRRSVAEATLARNGIRPDGWILAVVLLVVAAVVMAGSGEAVAAVVLVATAVIVLQRRPDETSPPPTGGAVGHDTGWSRGDVPERPGQPAGVAGGISSTPPPPPPPATGSAEPAWSPPPPPPAPPRSPLGRIVISSLLVLAGMAALLEVADIADVSVDGFLAVALIGVGIGLVVGAWYGRARTLIALGIVLTVVLAGTSVVDVPVRGGMGERRWSPTSLAELPLDYRLVAGEAVLDLTGFELPARPLRVKVHVGMGELVIVVPRNAAVDVDAEVGVGQLVVFGVEEGGTRLERRVRVEAESSELLPELSRRPRPGRLVIDARVGMGEMEVRRATA